MAKRKKSDKSIKVTIILLLLFACYNTYKDEITSFLNSYAYKNISYNLDEIPEYNGDAFVIINNNEPNLKIEEGSKESFEFYSSQDLLGRSGVAFANIGIDLMPNEERGSIGSIKPTGWHTIKYDIVEGKYLYNRCHLIGHQLSGENANPENLITCTRQMNVEGMLTFENMVAEYVEETKNHVLYRVTPIYEGDNLLASGVQMEALSVEDNGEGIKFNVYVYNVQDGVKIDYSNGESALK
ncbi:MAG: hypothetical protein E7161_00140 [Firmicutes bacterium]|nr:hypothetical protein [Bacillota bacterium]